MTKESIAKKYDLVHTEPLHPKEHRNPPAPHQIGKSRDGKWYGWSHRAIYGFKSKSKARAFARSVS